MWKRFPPEIKARDEQTGVWAAAIAIFRPALSHYPWHDRRGRSPLLLENMIETGCRVSESFRACRIPDVPWQHAVEMSSRLPKTMCVLTLVKDGVHRRAPGGYRGLIMAVAELGARGRKRVFAPARPPKQVRRLARRRDESPARISAGRPSR